MASLREIDLALASYPEEEWDGLAGPVLLSRHRHELGIDPDEAYGAVRRASYLAAAAGDPEEGDDPTGPAVAMLADELSTRERRSRLSDCLRQDVARAVAERLPRVEAVLRRLAAPDVDVDEPWRLFCAGVYRETLADDADG